MPMPLFPSPEKSRLIDIENSPANLGLVFDKYFGDWNDSFDGIADRDGKTAKSAWVGQIVKAAASADSVMITAFAARQRAMVQALGGSSYLATASSRFVTGTGIANPLENGFVFHPTLGLPYLPASGLKGAVKAFWTQWHLAAADAQTKRIFGEGSGAGSAIFFDMLPVGPVHLAAEVMTPHYGPWYQNGEAPGDWHSPTPIPFIAVEEGAEFQISFAPRVKAIPQTSEWTTDCAALEDVVKSALCFTGLGAKTAVGYGRFALTAPGNLAAPQPQSAPV